MNERMDCPEALSTNRSAIGIGFGGAEIPELHSFPPQPPLLWAFCWGKNTIDKGI